MCRVQGNEMDANAAALKSVITNKDHGHQSKGISYILGAVPGSDHAFGSCHKSLKG